MTNYRYTRAVAAAAGVLLVLGLSACNRGSTTGGGTGAKDAPASSGKIGIDLPRSDTDFWNSYTQYLDADIKSGSIATLPISNSQNDITKLVANVQVFMNTGAKAIVMAPQDTGAIASTLDRLAAKKIPVVTVDTLPDRGKVYMVVRADNRAYGRNACEFLGQKIHGKGTVVEFEGDLTSVNGRDRTEGFADCMKQRYPDVKILAEATDWKGDVASAKLQADLAAHPEINAIYMQAGGVFLQPTLALLQQRGLLVPPSDPKHIVIFSSDGIPQELTAIRKGQIDATVSQPADLYAKYSLFYAQAALTGRTFQPGPTDHGSTIIKIPNGLEDLLPAPLVTAANVNDKALWGNSMGG